MRWAVIGCGAVGSTLAAALSVAGNQVFGVTPLFGRRYEAMDRFGLNIDSARFGKYFSERQPDLPDATGIGDGIPFGPVMPGDEFIADVIAVATRVDAIPRILPVIEQARGDRDVPVLVLTNGLLAPEIVENRFPGTTLASMMVLPVRMSDGDAWWTVQHYGNAARIDIGWMAAKVNGASIRAISDCLKDAGFDSAVVRDTYRSRWKRAVHYVPWAASCAAFDYTVKVIYASNNGRFLEDSVREAANVAAAYGIGEPEKMTRDAIFRMNRIPAGVMPSMARQISRGESSEVDGILGDFIRRADEKSIRVPNLNDCKLAIDARLIASGANRV